MVSDFSKKQNNQFFSAKFWFRAAGILFIVIAVLLLVADFRIYQKSKELNSQITDYQKQIQQIKKRNEALKEEIASSNNADYIEKIAREQENMQKPGEKVVSFVMQNQQPNTAKQKPENFFSSNVWTSWAFGAWQWIKSKF